MRTTIDLDDDVLEAARELARHHGTSIGSVVSAMAREGIRRTSAKLVTLPVIRARPGSAVISSETVRKALDDP